VAGDDPAVVVHCLTNGQDGLTPFLARCKPTGQVTNKYGVRNEETVYHPDLFVCRAPRLPWPEFRNTMRWFS
jgi:hypothetical protein